MNEELKEAIRVTMIAMLTKFNDRLNKSQSESPDKLASWADYLAFERKFTVAQVATALEILMRDKPKFMPSAYEIAGALQPMEPTADEIGNFVANEIIQKCRDFGPGKISEMMNSLSYPAQATIEHNRYLISEVFNSYEKDLPNIRAQIRGVAKAVAENYKNEKHNQKLARIGIENKSVFRLHSGGLTKLEFKDDEQG